MTLEQIARLAAVSRATVSRVINDHPHVRPDVRERVWTVIQRHGYAPNTAARALLTKRTNALGLLLPLNTAASGREAPPEGSRCPPPRAFSRAAK